MTERTEANKAVKAINEAPVRLAQELLRRAGLRLSSNSVTEEQLAVLESNKNYKLGTCHFVPNRHNHKRLFLEGTSFSLVGVSLPKSYINNLPGLLLDTEVDQLEYHRQTLFSPIHQLHITTHRQGGSHVFKSFLVFAAQSHDLIAVRSKDVMPYVEAAITDHLLSDAQNSIVNDGDSSLRTLREAECAILADAVMATAVTY